MDAVSQKSYIKKTILKNLLLAHERIAKEGDTKEIVHLSKYILRLTQNGHDEIFYLRTEKDKNSTEEPPEKSEQDIAKLY